MTASSACACNGSGGLACIHNNVPIKKAVARAVAALAAATVPMCVSVTKLLVFRLVVTEVGRNPELAHTVWCSATRVKITKYDWYDGRLD